MSQARTDAPWSMALFTPVVAVAALILGIVAVVKADDEAAAGSGSRAGAAEEITVALNEFTIDPSDVRIGEGGVLNVRNAGAIPHNLTVKDEDLGTADLVSSGTESLSLEGLPQGEYTLVCTIAGHEAAGMVGSLTVTAPGEAPIPGSHAGDPSSDEVDYAALDQAMTDSIMQFPAETEGKGVQPLDPTVASDGTKEYTLTAEIIPWEVEPGKIVQAWAYNKQVPGPAIRVDPGDRVRITVKNRLPMGTDVHWHGVRTPNAMDGVAPITQDLIDAGEDFVYEFDAAEPAVGMYHAHHHGQMQVTNGLFGPFTIGDVPLPAGRTIGGRTIPADLKIAREIPMVLNDAGVIGLSLNGKGFPATEPYAVERGEWLLINYYNEGLQSHPMHLHQFPQLVIAKDGIPLDVPYWADTLNVAPGERYTVITNPNEPGTWVWHCHILTHVERETGMFGMVTAVVVS